MANLSKLNTTKVVTPHAAVKIWNYRDRIGADGVLFDVDEIDQIIISTVSLLGISISKNKAQPNGQFELTLAPTKNWVKTLTPGSWLVIMMANTPITESDFQTAKPDKIKFFGRIDSVEVNSTISSNGDLSKIYRVIGSDWAQIFNSVLYVDPISRDLDESAISTVGRFIYEQYTSDISRVPNLPSSTDNIRKLIELWGKTNQTFKEINKQTTNITVIAKPEIAFSIPQAVSNYFQFKTEDDHPSNKLTSLIHVKAGKLNSYDDYNTEQREAIGVVKPDSIFGAHTFWQVLMDNCNHILNEMVTDIRWEPQGDPNAKAQLTLYKRIRPFIVRESSAVLTYPTQIGSNADPKIVTPLISKFSDLRRVNIPVENVISISAGTNWRDKYNYAEIQIDKSLLNDVFNAQIKINNAVFDKRVFGREGFKPIILQSKYIPPKADNSYDVESIYNWKFLLKEWYFDIHNMLNGVITFTGIDEYIQVGDNFLVRAEVLGIDDNMNSVNVNFSNTYLLAHVENVSHSFSNNPESNTRSFITTIQFVRGIITDQNGQQFTQSINGQPITKGGSGLIDQDAKTLRFDQENNNTSVVTNPAISYSSNLKPNESSGEGSGNGNN